MAEEQLKKIYDMLKTLNDDKLFDTTKAPNDNIIYHLYSDGQITYQKGGWAYLDRSEYTILPTITKIMNLDINKFAHKCKTLSSNNTYGYIIVTSENACKIREEMVKYCDLLEK